MPRRLPRNVYLLGLLSLFNDVTADMITPLLPAYLAAMGLGAGFLGVMEGLANSLSNVTMLFSGWMADRTGRNKRLTVLGYGMSVFSRLFLAIPIPAVALVARVSDRIGKGIRTAPRDRLLTASVEKKFWGEAFGVQRAMDHAGALIGPLIAAWLLAAFHMKLSTLFLVACIPSVLSLLLVPRGIKEVTDSKEKSDASLSWKRLPPPMKRYVGVIFFAALSTPSELFLLMRMKDLGMPEYQLPIAWWLMTLMTLLSAYAGGILADRWSRRRTIGLGWTLFALVYLAFALTRRLDAAWVLLAAYGFQMGLVESAERAYPSRITDTSVRGTALGWYYFAYGMGLLPASVAFGFVWKRWGAEPAFLMSAGLTVLAIFLLTLVPSDRAVVIPKKAET